MSSLPIQSSRFTPEPLHEAIDDIKGPDPIDMQIIWLLDVLKNSASASTETRQNFATLVIHSNKLIHVLPLTQKIIDLVKHAISQKAYNSSLAQQAEEAIDVIKADFNRSVLVNTPSSDQQRDLSTPTHFFPQLREEVSCKIDK